MIALVVALAFGAVGASDAPSLNTAETNASLFPHEGTPGPRPPGLHLVDVPPAPSFSKPVALFTIAGSVGAATVTAAVASIIMWPRAAAPAPNLAAALGNAINQGASEGLSLTLAVGAGLGVLISTALFIWAGNSWSEYSQDRRAYEAELEFARSRPAGSTAE